MERPPKKPNAECRDERIIRLYEAVRSGTYFVPAGAVADALLRNASRQGEEIRFRCKDLLPN